MESILLTIFGSLLVYGYLNLAMRYIKLITSRQKVKVLKTDRNATIITFVVILIWLIMKVVREYGNDNFQPVKKAHHMTRLFLKNSV